MTSPSRTLIDCAEFMTVGELRAAFARAQESGLLDEEALRAARACRVAADLRLLVGTAFAIASGCGVGATGSP